MDESTEPFLTLAAAGVAETRERASTFHALAAPVAGEAEARALLDERRRAMWDATHHCSAWRLQGGLWRANDDGEPSGSAGAPILAAIDGAVVTDCIVIVTRYYGGTKLGVGGLIRAYGEAAALALEAAPKRRGTPARRLAVRYAYAHTAAVMRLLEQDGAQEIEHGYAAGGAEGEVAFTLPLAAEAGFRQALRDATAGAVHAEELGATTLYSAA
jgi:uncharacterized YigZ family protein